MFYLRDSLLPINQISCGGDSLGIEALDLDLFLLLTQEKHLGSFKRNPHIQSKLQISIGEVLVGFGLPSCCVPTKERLFFVDFDLAVVLLLQQLPHQGCWLPELVVSTSDEGSSSYSDLVHDILDFGGDCLRLCFSQRYSVLVGKYHDFVPLFIELLKLLRDIVVPEEPVVFVLGELGSTLDSD